MPIPSMLGLVASSGIVARRLETFDTISRAGVLVLVLVVVLPLFPRNAAAPAAQGSAPSCHGSAAVSAILPARGISAALAPAVLLAASCHSLSDSESLPSAPYSRTSSWQWRQQ